MTFDRNLSLNIFRLVSTDQGYMSKYSTYAIDVSKKLIIFDIWGAMARKIRSMRL